MYILEKAISSDSDSIRALIEKIWINSPIDKKKRIKLFHLLNQTHSSEVIKHHINSGTRDYLLLKESGSPPVAFASYSFPGNQPGQMLIHQVYDLMYLHGYRNQIILLDRIEMEAKMRSAELVSIRLQESSKVKFLESMGYQQVNPPNEEKNEAPKLVMCKYL